MNDLLDSFAGSEIPQSYLDDFVNRYESKTNKASSINIISLWLQETGTYNQQFLRPYETSVDQQTMNALVDRFASSRTSRIDPFQLGDLTSNILRPATTPEAKIGIVNGWNERRVRFVMRVNVTYTAGGSRVLQISGYTDHVGLSLSGFIDPNMVFYINSIVSARSQIGSGNQQNLITFDNSHVHSDYNFGVYDSIQQPGLQKLIRPVDIYNNLSLGELFKDTPMYSTQTYDARNVLKGKAPQFSTRENSIPTNYSARILNAAVTANNVNEFDYGNNPDRYKQHSSLLQESRSSENAFITAISQIQHGDSLQASSCFTLKDLIKLDPNTQNIINYAPVSMGMRQVHGTGLTANWHGSDGLTIAASIVANAVPSIMVGCSLTNISFSSTNSGIGGQVVTIITSGNGVVTGDLTQYFERFKTRLEYEVLKDISYNNTETFFLEVVSDLSGETWIKIAVGNSSYVDFVVPSFGDGIFAPTITTDNNLIQRVSNDFGQIVESLSNAIGGTTQTHNWDMLSVNF